MNSINVGEVLYFLILTVSGSATIMHMLLANYNLADVYRFWWFLVMFIGLTVLISESAIEES